MGAAFLHAGWNVLAKVSKDTLALMWWASLFGTIGYGLWLLSGQGIFLNPSSWLPFMISAAAETGYFVTLVLGYSEGDLSLVYPLSRGGAPIFAAIWSAFIFEERLPVLGYLGVGLIVAGICVVSLPVAARTKGVGTFHIRPLFRSGAALWAIACAVFISIFSVSDKVAVAATPPLVYNWWVIAGNTVLWFPIVWRRSRIGGNLEELRSNWRGVFGTSIAMPIAYAAALAALALTSASYVVAGRGSSVIIGAAVGALLLKESFGLRRIFGAIVMVAGLAMIAFA